MSDSNDSLAEAVLMDSQWKAIIPITSTHFLTSNDGNNVIPNNTGQSHELNMLDMFNPDILHDDMILR